MWKLKAAIDLVAMNNEFFLVKFASVDDYDYAKYGGPWLIFYHYLTIRPWKPNFDTAQDSLQSLLVWVRIPCLPIEYYDRQFFMKAGEKIGTPVQIDEATSLVSQGLFARMCVMVDLDKPLISKFEL